MKQIIHEQLLAVLHSSSIHPQGWVPIETEVVDIDCKLYGFVAFTPKGGCPLKPRSPKCAGTGSRAVAFTPKGGCPLKPLAERKDAWEREQ